MEIDLQPFTQDDISTLIEWIDSEAFLVQWTGHYFTYPLTRAQLESHLLRTRAAEPECLAFQAIAKNNGALLGHIELDRIQRAERTAWISRVIVNPKAGGNRGIGTIMMKAIVKLAFTTFKLDCLRLHVIRFNLPAIACYKKVGFTVEETINENFKIGDKYWSTYRMKLERRDWVE